MRLSVYTVKLLKEWHNLHIWGALSIKTGGRGLISRSYRKAQIAFSALNKIWHSTAYSTQTKLCIFNTNVKAVLLYGCETWRNSKCITAKLQVLSAKMFRKSSSQFHSCNKRLTYKFHPDCTCWYLTLFQVKQIQDSHKDFQISVKTFPLTYTHFEEWMSPQPILKTLSFDFSVQIHFWTDNNTNKFFTLYHGYISPCFQLLSYSATIFTNYFILIITIIIIINYFMLWYWLLNISLE